MPDVVVGVRVERLAEPGIVALVALEAGQSAPAWVADAADAVLVRASMDRPEGGGGQGGEDARVCAYAGWYAFLVAEQAGADQVVGVAPVQLGAGGAAGGAAVAAADQ